MSKRSAVGRLLFTAVVVLTFLSLIPMASAAAIGTFNESSCAGGGVEVTLTTITWLPSTLGGTAGCIVTGLGTSVTYTGGSLGAGVVGNILNLPDGGPPVDNFMSFPYPGPTTVDFVLTSFGTPSPTNGTNCATLGLGQSCIVLAGSPFLLTNSGGGNTSILLLAYGTITDSSGIAVDWSGSYTTQLTISPGVVQADILGTPGFVESAQSGQFTGTTVPEPFTLPLIGGGLMALGMIAKKRKTRA